MTLLITGGGLVGSQIAALAVQASERPIIYDQNPQTEAINKIVPLKDIEIIQGDVLEFETFQNVIKTRGIDRIVHTAANPMLTVGAQENPYDAIKLNILGTANALELARKHNVRRLVFPSSSVLYTNRHENTENGRLSENNYPRPTTIYASTKLACENLGLNYAESYGLDFVALRFRAVFGPWSGTGGGGGPTNILRQAVEKSLRGERTFIPARTYEFVYSKDAARSAILALDEKKKFNNRVYNVGMGKVYSPQEIANMINDRITEAEVEIETGSIASASSTKTEPPIDLTRSKIELGYEPIYDMPHALDDYVSWYRQLS